MKLKITVHGVAYEVDVEVLDVGEGFPAPPSSLPHLAGPASGPPAPVASSAPHAGPLPPRPQTPRPAASEGGTVSSPIAGTVVSVKVKEGDAVAEGQVLLVIEAMKMNTSIAAPSAGTVGRVHAGVGDSIREGQALVDLA